MNPRLCVTGADVVTPFRVIRDGVVVTDGARIDRVGKAHLVDIPSDAERVDLPGHTILPGLVDLHLHGIGGICFDDAEPDAMAHAAEALCSHGVTSALATLVPRPIDRFLETIARVRGYLEAGDRLPVLCGIHAEGPFLNPEWHGALAPEAMWPGNMALAERLFDAAGPWLKLLTIAPEMRGNMEIIRECSRRGIRTSVGHSCATHSEIEHAIDNGLTQVTHIFNAMPLNHHRDPGVLGAAYIHQELKVQLIADGVHVHPAIMQFLVKIRKGRGGILLVSDAMPASGLPDGDYEFAGKQVHLRDGVAQRDDGTLAGSALTLDCAVRNMVTRCDTSLGDAARMAGLNPARVLRMDEQKGILAAGHDADFIVLDDELRLAMTVLGGGWCGGVRARAF